MRRKLILVIVLILAPAITFVILNSFVARHPKDLMPSNTAPGTPLGNTAPGQSSNVMTNADFPVKDRKSKELAYRVRAEKLVTLPDGKVQLTEPRILLYSGKDVTTTVEARSGELIQSQEVSEEQSRIKSCYLEKEVVIANADGMKAYMDDLQWD